MEKDGRATLYYSPDEIDEEAEKAGYTYGG
jgi:hypothetical protein